MKTRAALAAALAGTLGLLLVLPAGAASFGGRMGGMGGFGGGRFRGGGGMTRSMAAPPVGRVGAPGGVAMFRGRGFGDRDDRVFRDQDDRIFRGRDDRIFRDRDDFLFRRDRDDFFFRHRRFRDRDDDFSLGLVFGFGAPFYGYAPYAYPYPYSYAYPAYPQTYSAPALLSYLSLRWVGRDDLRAVWTGPSAGIRYVTFVLIDGYGQVVGSQTIWTPPYRVVFPDVPAAATSLQIAVTHPDGSVDTAVQGLPY